MIVIRGGIGFSYNYVVLHVQVKVPGLQARKSHSAAAFSLAPGVVEVTIFGGYSGSSVLSKTTVLRFGELAYKTVHHLYMH